MIQRKKSVFILGLVTILIFASCKKFQNQEGNEVTDDTENTPTFTLDGSPAENLITVFEAGITELESNSNDPAGAASGLEKILNAVSVEELRSKAKAAKESGQGASVEEKKRLSAAFNKYKKLAAEIGGKDPGAFNAAHTKWSAAFGVK